jgi:hypothetical protein
VEVPVADVADDRGDQPGRLDVAARLEDALGQPGDRDARVGGEPLRARAQGAAGLVGPVARAPQPPPLALVRRPREAAAAVLGGERPHLRGLRGHLVLAAVELEEERRGDLLVEAVVAVDCVHLHLVEQLDAGDRDRVLQDRDHAVHGAGQRWEGADRGRHRLGGRLQAQGQLGDEPQGALRADEQVGQVVARRGLAGTRAGADHLAARGDHGERQDVLAHRAVADGGGARRPGGGHPAQGRVCARVDGEEDALGAQALVELAAGDAGLHGDVHVLDRQPDDRVELAHVDAHPAAQGGDMTFKRGARPEGDDRHPVAAAEPDDGRRLLGGARVHDEVGRRGRVPGLVAAVEAQLVGAGEHPVGAEARAEVVRRRPDRRIGHASLLAARS